MLLNSSARPTGSERRTARRDVIRVCSTLTVSDGACTFNQRHHITSARTTGPRVPLARSHARTVQLSSQQGAPPRPARPHSRSKPARAPRDAAAAPPALAMLARPPRTAATPRAEHSLPAARSATATQPPPPAPGTRHLATRQLGHPAHPPTLPTGPPCPPCPPCPPRHFAVISRGPSLCGRYRRPDAAGASAA